MKIDLLVISHKIKNKILNIFISEPDRRELVSTRLFSVKLSDFDPGAVYIGKTGDVMANQDSQLPANLICIGYGDVSAFAAAKKLNILVIDGSGVVDVLNEVQGIFDFYNAIDKDLTNEIMREGSLQSILDVCSRFFDNPVFVVDTAKKLIAQSSNLRDPEWADVDATGFAGVDVINRMIKLDMLSDKVRKPKLNKEEKVPPTMTTGIFINNEKIGSVGIKKLLSDISDAQFGLVEHVADVLAVVFSKGSYSHYVKTGYSTRFIIDLIKGTSRDIDMIRYNLANLGWNLNDEYLLLKIIPDPKDAECGILKYSGELIKNLFKSSVMLIINDIIIIVVNVSKCDDGLDRSFEMLREFLDKRNILCGTSMNFFDFSLISDQYSFASAAVDLGKAMREEERLFSYEKFIIPHLISICDQKLNVRMLCHPAALKLYEYDMINKGGYMYCLYVYLKNEKSLVLTSKILNIHRSTLIYRLNKISEIIKIDMDDADIRFHMILSYEILHYLESRLQ